MRNPEQTAFYKSKQWKKLQRYYMDSKNWICERCGEPAKICHHRIYINPKNVNDPDITLNVDNLECLCQDCHNKEHSLKHDVLVFNSSDGSCMTVKECGTIQDFKKAIEGIESLEKKGQLKADG